MLLTTITLATMLATGPQAQPQTAPAVRSEVVKHVETHSLAVDLHPMTEEEKTIYPGREHWDKTEWYESQFKSAKVVIVPEHVDEWHNGGVEVT